MSEQIEDEGAKLFFTITQGIGKAWEAYKSDRITEVARELAATKSDLDSLIRIQKIKLKELEQEIVA